MKRLVGMASVATAVFVLVAVTAATAKPPPPPTDYGNDGPPPVSAASFGATTYPAVYRIATSDPVVFVTIDDGSVRSQAAYDAIRARGWPVTNFLLPGPLSIDPNYFKTIGNPSDFGNHTMSHPSLTSLSYAQQRSEICGARDQVASMVGTKPGWFRPPYGNWNSTTLQAANDCGYPGVVLWDVTVNGSVISTGGGPIARGDIILLHYVDTLPTGISTLAAELDRLGLHPARLASYLPAAFGAPVNRRPATNDFDGDGKTDIGVLRATAPHATTWFNRSSNTGALLGDTFGDPAAADIALPGDYDGDRRTDVAVVRPGVPDVWYVHRSSDGGYSTVAFGQAGDRPVSGDFDGDGRVDLAVVRPGSPDTWYVMFSSGGFATFVFGDHAANDIALAADFDGDRRADPTVRRTDGNGNSHFISALSTGSYREVVFGRGTDRYVPGDFDADGVGDLVAVRAVSGHFHWFVALSHDGVAEFDWGNTTDALVPGDFTGDGRADAAVERPGVPFTWFVRDTATGALLPLVQWGTNGDRTTAADAMQLVNTPA